MRCCRQLVACQIYTEICPQHPVTRGTTHSPGAISLISVVGGSRRAICTSVQTEGDTCHEVFVPVHRFRAVQWRIGGHIIEHYYTYVLLSASCESPLYFPLCFAPIWETTHTSPLPYLAADCPKSDLRHIRQRTACLVMRPYLTVRRDTDRTRNDHACV